MASFRTADAITGVNEGGYSNNPNDRGGETWRGIARRKNPGWSGWVIIDEAKRKPGFPTSLASNSLLEQARLAWYKENVWDVLDLDSVNDQRIANELYDTGVNMGTGTAGIFLQRCLNVANQSGRLYPDLKVDGNVGPVTVAALNKHPKPLNILKSLNCLQGEKYIAICEANPSQELFYNGWMARVMEYFKEAA